MDVALVRRAGGWLDEAGRFFALFADVIVRIPRRP